MNLSDFDFKLPTELIAQDQIRPRDRSRLMVLEKETGKISHCHFFNILNYLNASDILVVNNSKVFPSRLLGNKTETGGSVEIFLIKEINKNKWQAIGKNLKEGITIIFSDSPLIAKVLEKEKEIVTIEFNISGEELFIEFNKIGHVPLPPYIKRDKKNKKDVDNYQTIYAKKLGSVAAPTAGLHFTPDLLDKIAQKGIKILEITLHVGLGTFAPVKVTNFQNHKIHSEFYSISPETISEINKAKKNNQRIIAVGTTTTRVLEHVYRPENKNKLNDETNIFIYPGYKFNCVDGMITNFHLPKSTLMMLVSAFTGLENVKRAYAEAINQRYRFYSYGDAMLIV